MSYITGLDVSLINGYTNLSSTNGKGNRIREAMNAYRAGLSSVSSMGFQPDDTSNAHAVIDTMNAEMECVMSILDNINSLFDESIEEMRVEIIEKEDALATVISEV